MQNQFKWLPKALVIFLSCLLINSLSFSQTCNTNKPVSYTIAETSTNEIWIPDASAKPWRGGDTLKIPAKYYSLIEISNFAGDPCKPIVIINTGGQVVALNMRIRNDSRYFKVTGTGTAGIQYGFKIDGGMFAISLSHDFEVDHFEATGGSLGFYFKTTPSSTDPRTYYTAGSSTNYEMKNIYIHHNYMHDIHGEAMYIGHTGPSGNQEGTGYIPLRLNNVEICYNNCVNIDWDGIQLSNARDNAKIHDNTITNFGVINKGSQQAGIILGGNTNGDIYNNTVTTGTGNGIQVFGYGTIRLYNNKVESAGYDLTSIGQESVYVTDAITSPESNPKQQIYFYDNVVNYPTPKGAIRVGAYSNNSLPSSLTNNQYCIPNAASNWQAFYVVANPVGSTLSNNVLACNGTVTTINQLPIASAGADQTITLPVASVVLNGSGRDADGSITSYTWTKISGPSAGLLSGITTATLSVTGLLQGTYLYELQVTDNNSAIGRDTIQVTVNPIAALPPVVTASDGTAIRVDVNGGVVYNNSQWNSWNTNSTLATGYLNYENGTASTVKATMDAQAMVVDNGAGYASTSTIPPSNVLRYNSTSTSDRTITLTGLTASSKYSLEVYGSRATTGNQTIVTVGNKKDTISTDNNSFDYAKFSALSPDNTGKLVFYLSKIGTWNYIAGFTIKKDTVTTTITATDTVKANAGADQTITLPVSSATLTGSGTSNLSTIASYAWTQISGPASGTITNATSATATASGLIAGTYQFQLKITTAAGLSATDVMQVTVNNATITTPPPPASGKKIRVNVTDGTSTYNPSVWNNWSTATTLTTALLKYEDGTASTVKAVLGAQAQTIDNGVGYATAAATPPSEVLRFNSASTSNRTITISGLTPSGKYSFEFYGSRKTTGNKSVFTIGTMRDTINTDNNVSDFAQFTNVSADGTGKITITVSRIGTWNYFAGFTITEGITTVAAGRTTTTIMENNNETVTMLPEKESDKIRVSVYPNPFVSDLFVELNDAVTGNYTIHILDMSGKIMLSYQGVKYESGKLKKSVNVSSLKTGNYILQVSNNGKIYTTKVMKG